MWSSLTRQFPPSEMAAIEQIPAADLVESILYAAPIVTLRILAEYLLHEDW